MKSSAFHRCVTILFVLALPVLFITTNVRSLASNPRYSQAGFRRYHVEVATRMSLEQLDAAAEELSRYFQDDRDELRISVVIDQQEISLFNPDETTHLRDVKELLQLAFAAQGVSIGIVVIYLLNRQRRQPRTLASAVLYSLAITVVLIAVLGGLALLDFDDFWTTFHECLFSNDLWSFDAETDRLIQMYPEPFWEDAVLRLGRWTAIEIGLLGAAALFALYRRPRLAELPPAGSTPADVSEVI